MYNMKQIFVNQWVNLNPLDKIDILYQYQLNTYLLDIHYNCSNLQSQFPFDMDNNMHLTHPTRIFLLDILYNLN